MMDNLSEEEKKAIEVLKNKKIYECLAVSGKMSLDIVLNLIEKQNKEIEDSYWKGYIDKQNESMEICKQCKYIKNNKIKDKMIDELIDELTCDEWDTCCGDCTHECEKDYDQLNFCIKEYFRKKVENENSNK